MGAGGLLQADHTYTWEIRVKDNAAAVDGQDCKQWSAWYPLSPVVLSFNTCSIPFCSIADFSAVPSTAAFGTDINFSSNVTGTGITGYTWKDGLTVLGFGALPSAGGTVTDTFSFAGVVNMTKTIIFTGNLSNGGYCAETKIVNLTVPPSCSVSGIAASPSTADFETNINFSGNISGTGITGYTWKDGFDDLGSDTLPATGGAVMDTYSFTGDTDTTKTITLIGTLSNGDTCQGTMTVNLTVSTPCTSTFKVIDSEGNIPAEYYYGDDLTFQFLDSSHDPSPISHYHWSIDGSPYVNGLGAEYDFAAVHDTFYNPPVKDYAIGLTVEHTDGRMCAAAVQDIALIDVPPAASCTADFSAPPSGTYDEDISFDPSLSSDSGEGNVVFTWRKSDDTLLGTSNSVTPFEHSFNSSTGTFVGVKLHVEHNLTGAICDSPVHWIGLADAPGDCTVGTYAAEYAFGTVVHSDTIQTHRLIWEPGRVTYDSFEGEGTGGTGYFHSVITDDISISNLFPGDQEWVLYNLYPINDENDPIEDDDKDVPPTEVILRDFSFVPLPGEISSPSPSRESFDFEGETVSWKGYTWLMRNGDIGDPGFGGWSDANVVGPDANDYLTLKLTNNEDEDSPVGCQIENSTAGLGYGTYTTVVQGNFEDFDKNVVFEGMTIHFPNPNYPNSTDPCAEFNAGETTSWDDPWSYVLLAHHNSWYGCGYTGDCDPVIPPLPSACTVGFVYDCGSTAGCHYGDEVDFVAFPTSGTPMTYTWTLDSSSIDFGLDGDAFASKIFSITDGASHTVHLSAVDGDGNVCTGEQQVLFVKLGNPKWIEVAPLLELGSIVSLILMFFARIILLRL